MNDVEVLASVAVMNGPWTNDDSVPLTDIREARRALRTHLHREGSDMVLPHDIAEALAVHQSWLDLKQYCAESYLLPNGLAPVLRGLVVEVTDEDAGDVLVYWAHPTDPLGRVKFGVALTGAR